LNGDVSKDNFDKLIKQALTKIASPQQSNRDGEAVLSGLGLWVPGMLDVSYSIYARSIKKLMDEKGEGMVLNRDEILTCLWADTNLWISKEFEIEADLEFLVLATLAALGEIEINLSGKTINSTNIDILKSLDKSDFFLFSHVSRPKELNLAAIREMFISLTGKDWSNQLKDEQTYIELAKAVENFAKRSAEAEYKIGTEYSFRNVVLIDAGNALKYRHKLSAFKGFCDSLRNYTSEAKLKNFKYSSEDLSEILKGKEVLVLVEKIIELTKEFDQEINYLLQAKQYIPNIPLLTNIQQSIDKLPEVLNNQEDTKIANYKAELKQLRSEYADWYLTQYLANRISEMDETQKSKILNSNQKAICDLLKDANFLSVNSYALWLSDIQKLVVADSKVNKEAIMHAPYQGFNPMEYVDKKQKTVDQLRSELDDIFNSWENTIRETLDDPGVAKNLSLLDAADQKLLSDYQKGTIELDTTNAKRICNLIQTLHKGLEKVELTTDSLKATFNKPLTPDEAINAFKKYIDSISQGKNRDNIRIILK
jgi:succinate dehydrogenase flavin-adding protein (antitoxin of CptAB toxin-antitoxin module)